MDIDKDYVQFNLEEAREAIDTLIRELTADPEYDSANLRVDMQHIYWHINSAWNGRHPKANEATLTDSQFEAYIQFPKDLTP